MTQPEALREAIMALSRRLGETLLPLDDVLAIVSSTTLQAQGAPTQPEALLPLTVADVIAAIYAVDNEARERGRMFPQTSDEQAEDRSATTRVVGMIRWYEKNTGCARLKGWPALQAQGAPTQPEALREALRDLLKYAEDPYAPDRDTRAPDRARAALQAQGAPTQREALPDDEALLNTAIFLEFKGSPGGDYVAVAKLLRRLQAQGALQARGVSGREPVIEALLGEIVLIVHDDKLEKGDRLQRIAARVWQFQGKT